MIDYDYRIDYDYDYNINRYYPVTEKELSQWIITPLLDGNYEIWVKHQKEALYLTDCIIQDTPMSFIIDMNMYDFIYPQLEEYTLKIDNVHYNILNCSSKFLVFPKGLPQIYPLWYLGCIKKQIIM